MPLHTGHELMIEMAAAEFDEVTIIISSQLEDPGQTPGLVARATLIGNKYENRNITVKQWVDRSPEILETDRYGTVINNEPFWQYWIKMLNLSVPDLTHIVSSDRYGQELARRLSTAERPVEWCPIDPDRELYNISARDIRANPLANWKYISKEFREFYACVVTVIGPESAGKTTLVNDLAEFWGGAAVPEYGRILSEAKQNNLTVDDFIAILHRHESLVKHAIENSPNGMVFVDTERFVTRLYADKYLALSMAAQSRLHHAVTTIRSYSDIIVLVPPVLEWVDDGTRVMSDIAERKDFYRHLKNFYMYTRGLLELQSTDRKDRVHEVSRAIADEVVDQSAKIRLITY